MAITKARRWMALGSVSTIVAASAMYACGDDDTAGPVRADAGTQDVVAIDARPEAAPLPPARAIVSILPVNDGGMTGSGTLIEGDGGVTLTLNVTNAPPGARPVQVRSGGSCPNSGLAPAFNPNPATQNGHFDDLIIDDAGTGKLVSSRAGLTIAGDAGVANRLLVIQGPPPVVELDSGTDAGTDAGDAGPMGIPVSGCGVIVQIQ